MPASRESFSQTLERFIHKFEANKTHYLSKSYLEAQARVDLISPFFKALGWDMENEAGLSHHEREVIVERGETEGYPDYNFRVGGQTKFFVEAKAPSEPLDTTKHILQAKGYAWNTKQVFFVVLTDFEGFRFYDASIKPDERNPDEGLLLKLNYSDYLKNIEKLWEFSRERVSAGSLDAMLPRGRGKPRLRLQVDEVFLDEMTGWREELAKNIFKNNPDLTAKQLNEVVQRLLDRIVFIRIAEDRHIIEKRQLADAVDEWKARGGKLHLFDWLNDLFHKINEDFNGEIFKPHLSETIRIDSEVLAKIIERLYPPKSPYRFDVIGVELLGSIYERYLGKTIRVTPKQARVEEKPEVRKAGGVYYTPKYIVDYIVRNTVGKIIEGKTPKQIEKIRVLDPACGSGSFLIGAFQCLIDYHVKWYLAHPEQEVRHAHPSLDFMREVHANPDGGHRLSVYRKAKILRNNLFGVDIDPQAVEITMMSLYLKALEGEMSQLPPKQHLLPELKYNIICGNSLIGPDIYDQGTLFGDEEKDRINAFDWKAAFPEVMKAGGFDAVIGNPPYIRSQTLGDLQRRYYDKQFASATGTYDIYVLFVERALSLLKSEGRVGLILPNKFFTTDYGAGLRQLLTAREWIERIVDFEDAQVFSGVGNYTCVLFLSAKSISPSEYLSLGGIWHKGGETLLAETLVKDLIPFQKLELRPGDSAWTVAVGDLGKLLARLKLAHPPLADLGAHIFQGLKTSADKTYMLRVKTKKGKLWSVETLQGETLEIEHSLLRQVVKGEHVQRYWIDLSHELFILYPYEVKDERASLLDKGTIERLYPHAWAYLEKNRSVLSARDGGVWGRRKDWYAYARSQNIAAFVGTKLLAPYMTTRLRAAPDLVGDLFFVNITTGGYGMKFNYGLHDPRYLTGLLNSKLLDQVIRQMTNAFRGGYFAANKQAIERLPFRNINFSDVGDKARHDKTVMLVERMLELNKKKYSGKLAPSQVDRLQREIAATDLEIDEVVYELYGITEDERKIVEGDG